MRSRFLALAATLVGIVATLLGVPAAATADPVPNVAVGYAYDGHHRSADSMYATTVRGPPATFDNGIAYDPDGPRLLGASARPSGPASDTTYDYTESARLAQIAARSQVAHQEAASGLSGEHVVGLRRGVAAKYGDEVVEGIGDSRTYIDLTKGGSIRNVGTNATNTEFAGNLTAGGWISRTSKDGAVQIFQRDGAKYVLRERAGSYGGWTADFTPAGAQDVTLKIRLGYVP